MRNKRTYLWAYLDGKPLIEVIQAALDNRKMVDEMKKILTAENSGRVIEFRTVRK